MIKQERDIKYINREFTDFKQQLVEFAKNYFPDSYNDFSPTSPGTMFIEMASYVGDVLSFYQDTQLQETYLQYAKDPANLYSLAYMMGYTPKSTHVSEVELQITQTIGAINGTPDFDYAAIISENTIVTSDSADRVPFLIQDKIDFSFSSSLDPTEVTIASLDEEGEPLEYLLTKKAKAFSSEIISTTRTFDTAEKFATITIDDTNIVGILDIVDDSSDQDNTWTEVPFLGQDTVFVEQQNTSNDANSVQYIMNLKRVPKRFVTRLNSQGQLQIQFGAGTTGQSDETFTPDPTNVGLGTDQGISKIDTAYDPSNFLYTGTYGIAPSNTTLTIRYLKGGGIQANVPANTLTEFNGTVTANNPNKTQFLDTVLFTNPQAATGGKDGDTIEELRQNSLRAFAEQGRTVTLQDYTVRALSLPSKFGTVSKVYVTQDTLNNSNTTDSIIDSNPLALSMYVLGYDNNTNLIPATPTLKQNLKTYMSQYMPVTDAINIKDAFIVNFGVEYEVLIRPGYNSRDVLIKTTQELINFFDIKKWSINQPINLSTIYSLLDRVKGVQTVQTVRITNKSGGDYSIYGYDIEGATKNNIVYPSFDPMIFELKFPEQDIKGRTTTL